MTTTSGSVRWDRLATTLAEAGIQARVDRHPYPGGVSYGITLRAGSSLVIVTDTWWRKNLDTWTGWQVYVEGPDAIVARTFPRTKKRSEVVRDVRASLGT